MTFDDASGFLHRLPRFTDQGGTAYRPGLERIEALLDAMGQPHRAFPAVHVAGTNGKGSTASLFAAVATAAGRRTGLHTSPHLFDVTERMRIDGVPAPRDWLAEAVARYRGVMEAVTPSFFEATVALSLRYFADAGVDLAVVEVGMGGRLDATNVLVPVLAVITTIGLDHTEFLGETLAQIAREKAGIIKPGVPVLTAASQPDALDVIREVARARAALLHVVQEETVCTGAAVSLDGLRVDLRTPLRRYDDLVVGLPGRHQATNACLAVRAAELVLDEVRAASAPVYTGLREVKRRSGLRGRLDVLQRAPLVVADVAHNPDGLATALAFVEAVRNAEGRLWVFFGAMRDKDVPAMLRRIAAAGAAVMPVSVPGDRALPAEELRQVVAGYGIPVLPMWSVSDGLAHFLATASADDALLITGSHQVVSQLPPASFTTFFP